MPLADRASAGVEDQRELLRDRDRVLQRLFKDEFRFPGRCEELAVGVEPSLLFGELRLPAFGIGPLPAVGVRQVVPVDARKVASLSSGTFPEKVEALAGRLPSRNSVAHAERLGHAQDALVIGDLILAALEYLAHGRKASLQIDIGALFLDAGHYREVDRAVLRALNGVVDILDDKELQFFGSGRESLVVGPAVPGVSAQDPQALDLAGIDALNDLVVGDSGLLGDQVGRDPHDIGDALPLGFIGKVAAREQAGRIAEEPGAHGIALACDGVAARARLADISGKEGEVHDGLCRPHSLVALVDAHGPPERNSLAVVDHLDELQDLLLGNARRFAAPVKGKGLYELFEVLISLGVRVHKAVVHIVLLDDLVGQGVHQGEV